MGEIKIMDVYTSLMLHAAKSGIDEYDKMFRLNVEMSEETRDVDKEFPTKVFVIRAHWAAKKFADPIGITAIFDGAGWSKEEAIANIHAKISKVLTT